MSKIYDLTKIIKETKSLWELPKKSLFHHTIGLIIGQKIKMDLAREIRKNLYIFVNKDEYHHDDLIKITDHEWHKICMNDLQKINIIKRILKLGNKMQLTDLTKVAGIGDWTIKSLKVLCDQDDDIFLGEDYWIRSKLKILFDLPKVPTISEANKLSGKFIGKKSTITKFLWRLTNQGAIALKNNQVLKEEHFLSNKPVFLSNKPVFNINSASGHVIKI